MDSMQAKKRFYKDVTTDAGDDGWVIKLDNRTLRSPAGALLHLPSPALAAAVADEWRAQDEHIDAASMPLFSLAVTVLDRVIPQQPAILRELASYGDNDLLCYRADDDDDLAARQQQLWQPWLEWADSAFGVSLEVATGIMPVNQPHAGGFHDALQRFDAWRLGALHRAVSLGGSLVLGLGFVAGRLDAEQLFNTAFLDELWQNEKWGRDYEAEDRQNYICAELAEAARFLQLLPDQLQAGI
jgi:chaperone required for assembly of F1-ATPase